MGDQYPSFKAAAVQTSPVFLNREATVDKACQLIHEASRNGARLVAFPETFVPGYPYWIWMDSPLKHDQWFVRLFEEGVEIPGPATDALCRAAKAADIYVVIGVNEKVPTNMGTMWNTNVVIDRQGTILWKHRKLVPTFAEKMIWSRGDGSGMRVGKTDIGILGTLACGENSNTLARYALLAQGEQVHVANYPAIGLGSKLGQNTWIHLRAGAHSCEGKVFTLVSTSTVGPDIVEMLGDTQEKRDFLTSANAYSAIYGPNGEVLASIEGEEGIIYADINIEEEIARKQWHDIIGHYNRFDVLSLNLNMDSDQPLRILSGRPSDPESERATSDTAKLLEQNQAELQELRQAIDSLSRRLGQQGK
ncbi:MAG: carbon-nitrogen hydrolase family protein [Dehalococcoidia bacterium]|nr:carbon-nitrogen hydrolase family protein [Dehalococcoidia bacterium]